MADIEIDSAITEHVENVRRLVLAALEEQGHSKPVRDAIANALGHASHEVGALARLMVQKLAATTPREELQTAAVKATTELLVTRIDGDVDYWQATKPGKVPNVFGTGAAHVPTNHTITSLLDAIHNAATGKGWSDHDGVRVPTHTSTTNRGNGEVHVSVRQDSGDRHPPADVLPRLWEKVRALDDLTSDVLLVCLAQWAKLSDGPTSPTWITADTILDARGIKRMQKSNEPGNWQHGHRREDRMAAGRALAQLDSLWIEIQNVEVIPPGRRRKPQRLKVESRAIAMLSKVGQTTLDGETVFLGARVMPGDWAVAYWNLGLRQSGLLAQRALEYDFYRERVEKRLAKYLAFQFRFNAKHESEEIHRKVATLLENAGIEPNAQRPERNRTRLELALNRLQQDDVIAGWGYAIEGERLPAKGWLPYWLNETIWLQPPSMLTEQYAKISRPKARQQRKAGGRS